MCDLGDKQVFELAALRAPVVCGRRMYRATKGAEMEDLSYDATMPVAPRAWRSIEEPDPPPALPAPPAPLTRERVEAFARASGLSESAARVVMVILPLAMFRAALR